MEAEEGINRGDVAVTSKAKMFYLTLPSNSSMTTLPDNTVANFRVKLPQALDLSGRWEVGLTEIQYPHSWCNVGENTHFVEVLVPNAVPDDADSTVATAEYFTLALNKGFYHSPKKIGGSFGELEELGQETPRQTEVQIRRSVSKSDRVCEAPHFRQTFSPSGQTLGIRHDGHSLRKKQGVAGERPGSGFQFPFMYCNVVQPTVVGDTFVPLLRIVPVEGKTGQTVTRTYQNIQYLPVQANNFETVEIQIAKDTGELVPFERGKAVVTLHFRKVRSL